MAENEVVKDKVNLPANIDLEAMAGAGMETASVKDMAIPFLKILQDLSPEIKKSKAEYIEGAEAGLICNTVTSELNESVAVVPCFYQFVVNEWKPNRGGYVATHLEASESLAKARNNGNDFVDTANWYCLIRNKSGDWTWGVIAMSSTALKHSRKLMTRLQSFKMNGKNGPFTPPSYAHILELSTAVETKDNNEWFNWKVEFADQKSFDIDGLLAKAVDFHDRVKEGLVKAVPPAMDSELEVY